MKNRIRSALLGYLTTAGLSTRRADANLNAYEAEVLRKAAQRLGDAFESEGRPGDGDTVDWCADELRRMADAAERGDR